MHGLKYVGTFYCPESEKPRQNWGTWRLDPGDVKTLECGSIEVVGGMTTPPTCMLHGVPFVKRKWKSVGQKMAEIMDKTFMQIGGGKIILFSDVAKVGTARCHICSEKIAKGVERIGFDHGVAPIKRLRNGGFISRSRSYVHRTCMVDVMFGGKPGKGCPGCTLKHDDQEFRAYKKMVEKQNA